MSVNRLKILKLTPPPDPESNDFPLPNPTWCQYIFKVLAQTGHDAVMKSGDVYKFIEEECHDYETYNGKLNPIYVVEDQSWDNEHFHVDFCRHRCSCGQFQENGYPCVHALYILYKCKNDGQAEPYIERGYLRKEIAKTCYVPPDGWNEMVDGYEEGEEAML